KEDEETFKAETIVKIVGSVHEFRGQAQLRIQSIRPAQVTDGVSVSDFLETAPVPKEELQEKLTSAIFEMQNRNIQRIVRAFIKKHNDQLLVNSEETKNHHA